MSDRAHYNSDELAAFKLADEIGDGFAVIGEKRIAHPGAVPGAETWSVDGAPVIDMTEVKRLLGTLAAGQHDTRAYLERAKWGLKEKFAKKRAALFDVIDNWLKG